MEDQRVDDLVRLGVDPAEAQAWLDAQEMEPEPEEHIADDEGGDDAAPSGPFVVWPENWQVVELFMRLQTKWQWRPDGRRDGICYLQAEAVMRLLKMKKQRRLFVELQEMERAALEALDEQ